MRKKRVSHMATRTVLICDICSAEQVADDPKVYWASRHAPILLKCPVDGINGEIKALACAGCRYAINVAINERIRTLQEKGQGQTQPGQQLTVDKVYTRPVWGIEGDEK